MRSNVSLNECKTNLIFCMDLQMLSFTLLRDCASACARYLLPTSALAAATYSSIKLHYNRVKILKSTYKEILELIEVMNQIGHGFS